jgi:PP-loop superfamily ATP-utilizing enzyme
MNAVYERQREIQNAPTAPPKFIRDGMNVDDIQGSKPGSKRINKY